MKTPELLSVVALLEDLPGRGMVRGQVGTVVETLDRFDLDRCIYIRI